MDVDVRTVPGEKLEKPVGKPLDAARRAIHVRPESWAADECDEASRVTRPEMEMARGRWAGEGVDSKPRPHVVATLRRERQS